MKILGLCFFFIILNIQAHMESEYGPHKGFIRMPGAFHTEVVQLKDNSFDVYLLDINFKKPMTDNSEIQMTLIQNNTSDSFVCKKLVDRFNCGLLDFKGKLSGKIILKSKRENAVGSEVTYDLPLRLASSKMSK